MKPTYEELEQRVKELEKEIAEHRRVEEDLRVKDSAVASSISAIAIADPEGNVTYVNDSFLKLWGYGDEKEVLGKPAVSFWQMEDEAPQVVETLSDGGSWAGELVARRKDGSLFDVQVLASKVTDEAGKPCMMASFVDITERKRAEARLQESEERYRNILQSIQEGYFEVDLAGNLTFFNDSLCKISGYSQHELMGMNNREYTTPQTARKLYQVFNEIYRTGKPATLMVGEIIRKDGSTGVLEISASLMTDSSGQPIGFRGVVRDVTERRLAEEEKKKIEARLLQSEKMASIGQLAAGVAHEINNPTGFISSNLNTLADYDKDTWSLIAQYRALISGLKEALATEEGRVCISEKLDCIGALEKEIDIDFISEDTPNLIQECKEGADRIKKIVIDLKDFAHPGEQKLKYADINRNLDSTLNMVWNELKYKAKITKEYGDLPDVECYPQQLNQVFMNLLVNAGQAIEKQGEIRIETRALDGKVEIRISDTGSGIPKENLSNIFDPFFTTKEVGKGTGLGLNVAYNIIEKHNGTIDVESELGKGTTFTIRIPIGRDA